MVESGSKLSLWERIFFFLVFVPCVRDLCVIRFFRFGSQTCPVDPRIVPHAMLVCFLHHCCRRSTAVDAIFFCAAAETGGGGGSVATCSCGFGSSWVISDLGGYMDYFKAPQWRPSIYVSPRARAKTKSVRVTAHATGSGVESKRRLKNITHGNVGGFIAVFVGRYLSW